MNHLKFTTEKLLVEKIYDMVLSSDCGAVSVFVGTTRDNFEDKVVTRLEYEAYESMGLKALGKTCLDLRKEWPDVRNIAIFHRLGPVPVKEASIVIAISSPHRACAIKAVEWCIDNVKKSVPIFKKEMYLNEGESQWKENTESVIPSKLPKLTTVIDPEVILTHVPRHLVQVKATNAEMNGRIAKFVERKRNEINLNNIRDFCFRDANDAEYSCARIDSKILKRKDSKGYLEVDRVYNNYVRDQDNFDFLLKFIPKDGVNERISNLESQLNMSTPVLPNIYKRIKDLEDRLLHLESISPEYTKFWDTTSITNQKPKKRKTVFTMDDVDSYINELEKQIVK